VKKLSVAPLWGRILAIPTNIRLGWKGLPEKKLRAVEQKYLNHLIILT
jgi:hypothetical protein